MFNSISPYFSVTYYLSYNSYLCISGVYDLTNPPNSHDIFKVVICNNIIPYAYASNLNKFIFCKLLFND